MISLKLTFIRMSLCDGVPLMAFKTSLIVGTILIAINHGDLILSQQYPSAWKIILTYVVPYCVSTWGAVSQKKLGASGQLIYNSIDFNSSLSIGSISPVEDENL